MKRTPKYHPENDISQSKSRWLKFVSTLKNRFHSNKGPLCGTRRLIRKNIHGTSKKKK